MSGVKNWLMEMQEYAEYLLDDETDLDRARFRFVEKYGENQLDIFDNAYHYQEEYV
tara:strand:+ start:661 stop:828 length:168 start_codon:yes stop_codon:yes gene_type:complete